MNVSISIRISLNGGIKGCRFFKIRVVRYRNYKLKNRTQLLQTVLHTVIAQYCQDAWSHDAIIYSFIHLYNEKSYKYEWNT